MIFFARHQRRRVPLQTTPPAAEHTAPNPAARRMRAAETTPIPVSLTRPYAPQPTADPLTAPDVPITETAVVGHQIRVAPSPSRHQPGPVVLTGWPVPLAAYPDPHRDPGPVRYAKAMQIVSAVTGTTSTHEDPRAWDARALTTGEAA